MDRDEGRTVGDFIKARTRRYESKDLMDGASDLLKRVETGEFDDEYDMDHSKEQDAHKRALVKRSASRVRI